jgi:hypothetical protein
MRNNMTVYKLCDKNDMEGSGRDLFYNIYQHLYEGTEETTINLRNTGLLVDIRTGNSSAITTSRPGIPNLFLNGDTLDKTSAIP